MELEMKVVEALARLVGIAEIDGMDDQSNVWRSAMLDANSLLEEIDALNSVEVKVRIVCLAQGAYASIASPEGNDERFAMDVLLPAGKSAHHGLYERADELLLIRGLPGSGKTTMAKKFAEAGYVHCEADQYFEANGEYQFDGSKLRAAHDDCLRRAIAAMDAGRPVVVANTFTRRWEMQPYLKAAKKRGINARIIEATGNWPNVHGVPADAIERMRARWETVIEGEQQ